MYSNQTLNMRRFTSSALASAILLRGGTSAKADYDAFGITTQVIPLSATIYEELIHQMEVKPNYLQNYLMIILGVQEHPMSVLPQEN